MSGKRRSSGRGGESSLGYLFGNGNSDEYSDNIVDDQSSKAVSVSGGGQSSLGYLFGSNNALPQQQESSPAPVCVPPPPPPYGIDDEMIKENSPEKPLPLPSNNRKISSYVYHKVDGENSKDFLLTGRPSTKVTSVPGGDSSVGYLFGDK